MNLYLSSYQFGNETDKLKSMLPKGSKVGHINNSKDFTTADPDLRAHSQLAEIDELNKLGFTAEPLDLKKYFHKESELREKLSDLDGIWVSGGNTFVLRQAMKISGFDNIFIELRQRENFLYGGYSAGVCVLCDSLKYIQHVDNPNDFPYPELKETIWEGLNLVSYGILPHYNSKHHESAAIGMEVHNCIRNKWLFKALSDGEVIIVINGDLDTVATGS